MSTKVIIHFTESDKGDVTVTLAGVPSKFDLVEIEDTPYLVTRRRWKDNGEVVIDVFDPKD